MARRTNSSSRMLQGQGRGWRASVSSGGGQGVCNSPGSLATLFHYTPPRLSHQGSACPPPAATHHTARPAAAALT